MNFICTKTRECRANNFLGLTYGPDYEGLNLLRFVPSKDGKITKGVDDSLGDRLAIFQTFQEGMNAALWRLKVVYFDKNLNTPAGIYNKWCGDKTGQKGLLVAQMMGVKPDTVLEFVFNDLKDLIHAMLRFEDSTKIFESDLINIPDAMYLEAIAYAVHRTENEVPKPLMVGNKIGGSVMPDAPNASPVTPAVPKVGLFQDPHFWGVVNQIGGLVTIATSNLSVIPTPIQPFVLTAGAVWTALGTIFHIFGLANPASTQSVKAGLFLIGFLLLASFSNAGILSYVGVPLNPGVGVTSDDLLIGPIEIIGVNLNNVDQVNFGLGFGLLDSTDTGLTSSTSTMNGNWAIGILGKAYLQNTNPDYVAGTFGIFGAFNLVKIIFNNSDFPMVSLSAERLPDGSIQGFFNLVDLIGIGSDSSYRKINR